jgi:hypothetical protein
MRLGACRAGELLLNYFSEADLKRVINSSRFQDARSEWHLFRFMDVLLAFHPTRARLPEARGSSLGRADGANRHHSLLRDPTVRPDSACRVPCSAGACCGHHS